MDPPANAGWLRLDSEPVIDDEDMSQLFNPNYVVNDDSQLHPDLLKDKKSLNLSKVNNDPGILGAAAILERAVNNTSVFFVLDVAGTRLLFPGDAQQGTWDHVLGDAEKTNLVRDVVFYKIGHHGSHNATPKRFVETILKDGGYAMLPWGLVRRWRDTIPKAALLQALEAHHHRVIRADAPQPEPGKVTVHEDLWTEVTFTAT
jgi:beta-lactamase superfamily II metal-dependent hydrolase